MTRVAYKIMNKKLLIAMSLLLVASLVACSQPTVGGETTTDTEAVTQTETQATTETETVAKTETETLVETELETEVESETEQDTEIESEIESDTETEFVTETVTETVTVTETAVVTEAESEAEQDTEIETETEVESENVSESEEESDSETEADIETETSFYSLYEKTEGNSFLYNTSASASAVSLRNSRYAVHFEVSENTFVSSLTISCSKNDTEPSSMQFSIWAWTGNYDSTVASEPAYTCTLQNEYAYANELLHQRVWLTVYFPELTIGEGEWLYQVTDGSNNLTLNMVPARNGLGGNEIVSVKEAFQNGRTATSAKVAEAYVTYETYDLTKEIEAPDADGYTKLADNKAHVIILTGQSNASGQAWNSFLQEKVSPEAWERYNNGYDNIKIYYNVDWGQNAGSGFVPVTLGQGSYANRFGPEVGLADYLSRAYPNETFYIIKVPFSGSGLQLQWKPDAGHYGQFVSTVTQALRQLEVKEGLDPEIFAFCWMQGETDAMTLSHAEIYESAFAELTDRISTQFSNYMAEGGMAILDATINEQSNWQYSAIVNAAKRNFSASRQNHYVLDTNALDIDTRHEPAIEGYDFEVDPMHYDSDDSIELGELFGRGIEQVLINAGYPVYAD